MTDRSNKVIRELDASTTQQDIDLKRLTAELDIAKRDLDKAKRERDHRNQDLQRLDQENQAMAEGRMELQIECLERELREAEAARRDTQTRMEMAHT